MKPLLKIEHLKKAYGKKVILNDLCFEVGEGEVVGLIGPNGAGKTTAFYLTMGLIASDSGSVYFLNNNVTKLPVHKRAKMGMGYLAQEPSIFRTLTVEQNILSILELIEKNKTQKKERLQQLLSELNLTHLAKKKACTLSGGERRRLEITRALVTKPKLLLLDEPFANIDPITIQDVKNMIRLLKQKRISVLITDHNAREIFSIVDRTYLIQDGTSIFSGTPNELIKNSNVRKSYLGEEFDI